MRWWRLVFRRREVDRQLDAELRDHVERLTADYVAAGMPDDEARRRARLEFGGLEPVKEACRDARRFAFADDAAQDVRLGARMLARNPGFAVVAILTLAIGIGATTAIFSVANAVLLRSLSYPDAGRLVRIFETSTGPLGGRLRQPLPVEDLRELRSASRTLQDVDAYGTLVELRLGRDETSDLPGARISRASLSLLGARAALGRLFDEGESAAMAPVLVLSHAAWRRHFAADPQVLGQTVLVEGSFPPPFGVPRGVFTVIGVMAEDFQFPDAQTAFWVPLNLDREGGTANIARLRDGASIEAAADEVAAVFGGGRQTSTFEVVSLQDERAAPLRFALQIFLVAAGLVLLVVCANVANLLLARAASRTREMAVRSALGAGRGRLVRQLLTESLLVATLGGAAGAVLAAAGVSLLRPLLADLTTRPDLTQVGGVLATSGMAAVATSGLDAATLAFCALVSVAAGALFGTAPALVHAGRSAANALRDGAATAAGFGRLRQHATRTVLVVAQVAVAVALLAVGGLLVHSYVRLLATDTGYDAANVLTFNVRVPPERSAVQLDALAERLVEQLETTPGISAAGYTYSALPTVGLFAVTAFGVTPGDVAPPPPPEAEPTLDHPRLLLSSAGYPRALGVRLRAGRHLDEHTRLGRGRGLLINRTLAVGHFGRQNPVGQFVYLGGFPEPWEVAGVVDDVWRDLDRAPGPQVFAEFSPATEAPVMRQMMASRYYYTVRTPGPPEAALPAIRDALRQIDAEAVLDNIATLEGLLAASIARPRLYAMLLGLLAAAAVVIAAIGVYGVMAYTVAQATREIGIRMALGARGGTVLALVLSRAAVLVTAGMVLGLAAALPGAQVLRGMIFGLSPVDPATFVGVTLLFVVVALLAAYVPARRATRVDPITALRAE